MLPSSFSRRILPPYSPGSCARLSSAVVVILRNTPATGTRIDDARTLRGMDLRDTPDAYLDLVPAITLTSVNTMSFFGLHRRLRGAVAGHLAAFEMTSSLPNKHY